MKTITVGEMALELGVGHQKVYEMLRRGQIPNIRNGARFIVSRAAFDMWLSTLGLQQPSAVKEGERYVSQKENSIR